MQMIGNYTLNASPFVRLGDPFTFYTTAELEPYLVNGLVHIFQIVHQPTGAVFTGTTTNLVNTYRQWGYKLSRIDYGRGDLNFAFRAVYTKQEDFYFRVYKAMQPATPNDYTVVQADLTNIITAVAKADRAKCLNVSKALSDKMFWIKRVPTHERAYRFGTTVPTPTTRLRVPKKKLIPGKVRDAEPDAATQQVSDILSGYWDNPTAPVQAVPLSVLDGDAPTDLQQEDKDE